MKRLVGPNNIVAIFFVAAIFILFINILSAGTFKKTCIGDNFILTNVTPTIQTIAILLSQEEGGKTSLIRGHIEFMDVTDQVIVGYLSIRFFKEDQLIGLEGANDKEGFFIISKKDRHVVSGLDGKAFFNKMEAQYHQKDFNFRKPKQIDRFGECQRED